MEWGSSSEPFADLRFLPALVRGSAFYAERTPKCIAQSVQVSVRVASAMRSQNEPMISPVAVSSDRTFSSVVTRCVSEVESSRSCAAIRSR